MKVHYLTIISGIYLMVIRPKLSEISYLEDFGFFVKIFSFGDGFGPVGITIIEILTLWGLLLLGLTTGSPSNHFRVNCTVNSRNLIHNDSEYHNSHQLSKASNYKEN